MPLRLVNDLKAERNVSAERSTQSSKCTALVLKHTKIQMYVLTNVDLRGLPLVVVNGPAKSTPTMVKGGSGRVRSVGRWPII